MKLFKFSDIYHGRNKHSRSECCMICEFKTLLRTLILKKQVRVLILKKKETATTKVYNGELVLIAYFDRILTREETRWLFNHSYELEE